jgi:hypothetical protein
MSLEFCCSIFETRVLFWLRILQEEGFNRRLEVVTVVPQNGDAHVLIGTRNGFHFGNRSTLQLVPTGRLLQYSILISLVLPFQDLAFCVGQ